MNTTIERLNLRIGKVTEKLAQEQKRTATLKSETKLISNREKITKCQNTLETLNEKLAKA